MNKQEVWAFIRRAWVTLLPKATVFLSYSRVQFSESYLGIILIPTQLFSPPKAQNSGYHFGHLIRRGAKVWSRGLVCYNTVCGIKDNKGATSTNSTIKLCDLNYSRQLICDRSCQSLSHAVGTDLLIIHHLLICYENTLAWQNQWLWFHIHVILRAYLLFSWASACSEVVLPEAAADFGGGGVQCSGGHGEDCWELCGDVRLYGMFFTCTVLLSKWFTNLIGIPGGRLPAVCLMARFSNLVHGEG